MTPQVTLVGESNPYGGDDRFALYPAPDGCSGHRLCCLILAMTRRAYLESFARVNLVRGKWNMKEAREAAGKLEGRLILLGSKVCSAFDLCFNPFTQFSYVMIGRTVPGLILPHPSGRNLAWNDPANFRRAQDAVKKFAPELAPLIGGILTRDDREFLREIKR